MQSRPTATRRYHGPSRRRRFRVGLAGLVASVAVGALLPFAGPGAVVGVAAAAEAGAPAGGDGAAVPAGAAQLDTPEVRALRDRAARAQQELTAATAAYAASERRLAEARAGAEEARGRADAARAEVARLRLVVQQYAAAAYKGGVGNDFVLVLDVMSSGNARRLDGPGYVDHVRRGQNNDLETLTAAELEAAEQSRLADDLVATAAAEEAELARRAAEVQALSQAAADELTAHLQRVDAALAAAAAEQAARGAGALARWQAYLDRLAAAGVVAPPAAALAGPDTLPAGLQAVAGPDGMPVPGVAEVLDAAGLPLRVLSAETVDAVTRALGKIGSPYRSGGRGPDAFDCGGLVHAVYPGLPAAPADQFAVTRPVDRAVTSVGDLVFLGGDRVGLTSVGIHLGEGEMVTAGKGTGSVQVEAVPDGAVLSFGRATLAHRAPVAAPAAPAGVECGGFPVSSGAAGAWGGYPNGLIPASALCRVGSAAGHLLRCDAATAFDALSRAYAGRFGRALCVTDSYRTYAGQVDVYARKPKLAAVPGTSNHGWALAVDLCGGVERFGTAEHEWMRANAAAYGWVHPRWAQAGGSRPEAWHWEFVSRS